MDKDIDSIVVFTDYSQDEILNAGGSGDWVLNPQRASVCTYLVCCRKANPRTKGEKIPKHAAFLVGRIKEVRKSDLEKNKRGQSRYFIEISDFASINQPDVWSNDKRNPLFYQSLEELGIHGSSLRFKPIPDYPAKGKAVRDTAPRKLSITEAKKALAASYGVKPHQIEIIIKA